MNVKEAKERIKSRLEYWALDSEDLEAIFTLCPELVENEDENLKNKSGYYKGGKFWKAITLWNAVKGKSPQRVSNRYILQECTWNISSLQHFADEVKNVHEVDLNYPIILDMNGNILDGAHRVVKAYLEGKDIDIVYLGDDEWPEPDYDEEKAVKESEDERIRKEIMHFLDAWRGDTKVEKWLAWLEKQKEQKAVEYLPKRKVYDIMNKLTELSTSDLIPIESEEYVKIHEITSDVNSLLDYAIEQKPAENLSKEDYVKKFKALCDAYEIKLPNREYDIYHLCDDLSKLSIDSGKQKPAEWNEEEIVNWLKENFEVSSFDNTKIVTKFSSMYDLIKSFRERFKSLLPRPHWKPNEEQMKSLKNCAYGAFQNAVLPALVELYENLKKL